MASRTDDTPDAGVAMTQAYDAARAAAEALRPQLRVLPEVAIVLGTGLGGLADQITDAQVFAYGDLPHFPRSTVLGHAGRLVVGRLAGVPVAALQGRFHLYEGYSAAQVVHPVRVLGLLGARVLIVTNASGGLDASYRAGDLMLLRDHIGLALFSGMNPLVGPNDEGIGPRFPALSNAYDAELRLLARGVAAERGIELREGVYVMVAGPSYETPAELAFLRRTGADAVGMSSVPEVIAGCHMGLRVLAISCVTNVTLTADGGPTEAPSHSEVVAAAEGASQRLSSLVTGIVGELGARKTQPET